LAVRLGDLGVDEHVGEPLAADAVEVLHVVGTRLDLERVELEPEAVEVVVASSTSSSANLRRSSLTSSGVIGR
jgi:hypothetical protein